jgi:hypothetical protein
VKCDKVHNPGKCKPNKDEKDPNQKPYCVLCKKSGHPASFRGCSEYQHLKEKLETKKKEIKGRISSRQNVSAFTSQNVPFSSLFQEQIESPSTPTDNEIIKLLQTMNQKIDSLSKQVIENTKKINFFKSLFK